MNCAIILAAGNSIRFQSKKNKNLTTINDIPIYKLTLQKFINTGLFTKILLVINPKDKLLFKNINHKCVQIIIGDANNRNLSLQKAMAALSSINANDIIVTHDCARCFVDESIISDSVNACKRSGYSSVVIPLSDSICLLKNNKFEHKDRDSLFIIQTPQSFCYKF